MTNKTNKSEIVFIVVSSKIATKSKMLAELIITRHKNRFCNIPYRKQYTRVN